MNDIDFLPAEYACVQTTRKNQTWLRLVFVVVVALMAAGWVEQRRSIRELGSRRDRMLEQATSVLSQFDSGDHIKSELKRTENSGRLLDGLRSQVPPTRWLAAIVEAMPAQTSLTEIHAEVDDGSEAVLQPRPGPGPGPGANKPDAAPVADPVQQDLDRLAKLTPRRALVISLRGSAADDLEVSHFLTALHRTGMFERVQLLFTDQHAQGDKSLRSFAIRLRTRPLNSHRTQRPSDAPVASLGRDGVN
jgi:Tfp pilus assembly protein PilN